MSPLKLRTHALAGIAVAGSLFVGSLASPALAADLDPGYADMPVALPQQTVTFGSGWYVRGDIAGTDFPGVATSPSPLGTAPTIAFLNKSNLGFSASLGGGYAFTNNVRLDVVADYHQPLHGVGSGGSTVSCQNGFTADQVVTDYNPMTGEPIYGLTNSRATYGTCQGYYDAKLSSYDVLANAYYDFGTWYGFTPYVGAGAGLSFGHYQTSATFKQYDQTPYDVYITDPVSGSTYHGNFDRNASGQYYNFAWALMAGFAYDLTAHAKLDIGYRYLNLGTVLSSRYALQQGHVGIRYMIDN